MLATTCCVFYRTVTNRVCAALHFVLLLKTKTPLVLQLVKFTITHPFNAINCCHCWWIQWSVWSIVVLEHVVGVKTSNMTVLCSIHRTSESNHECVQCYINNTSTPSPHPTIWVTHIMLPWTWDSWYTTIKHMSHQVNDLTEVEQFSVPSPALCTLRQLGWTISLQMEHSMSMKLNLSSSSSSVSSFPASLHTTHTAVWGRTGCNNKDSVSYYTPCVSIVCKFYL